MLKFSIVTPSLSQGRFIEECIRSVRNQAYAKKEHIIIDGGSKDETLSILNKYNGSITWISEPDKGQSDAINKGFKMASGDLVTWLNADDKFEADIFETVADYFGDHPEIDMLYGDFKLINEQGRLIRLAREIDFEPNALLFGINPIAAQAAFFRKSVLDRVGPLDVSLNYCMDHELWIRISKHFNIRHIPKVLGNFRYYPACKCGAHPEKLKEEAELILKRIHGRLGVKFYFLKQYYRSKRRFRKLQQLIKEKVS